MSVLHAQFTNPTRNVFGAPSLLESNDAFIADNERVASENEGIRNSNKEKRVRIAELKTDLAKLEAERSAFKGALKEKRERNEKLHAEASGLAANVGAGWTPMLVTVRQENAHLYEINRILTEEADALDEEIAELETKVKRLRRTIETLFPDARKHVDSVTNELEGHIEDLKDEIFSAGKQKKIPHVAISDDEDDELLPEGISHPITDGAVRNLTKNFEEHMTLSDRRPPAPKHWSVQAPTAYVTQSSPAGPRRA